MHTGPFSCSPSLGAADAYVAPNFGSLNSDCSGYSGCSGFPQGSKRKQRSSPWFAPLARRGSHSTQSEPWSFPTWRRDGVPVDDRLSAATLERRCRRHQSLQPLAHSATASKPRVPNGARRSCQVRWAPIGRVQGVTCSTRTRRKGSGPKNPPSNLYRPT